MFNWVEEQDLRAIEHFSHRLHLSEWEHNCLIDLCQTNGCSDKISKLIKEYYGYFEKINILIRNHAEICALVANSYSHSESLRDSSFGDFMAKEIISGAIAVSQIIHVTCCLRRLQFIPRPLSNGHIPSTSYAPPVEDGNLINKLTSNAVSAFLAFRTNNSLGGWTAEQKTDITIAWLLLLSNSPHSYTEITDILQVDRSDSLESIHKIASSFFQLEHHIETSSNG